MMKIMFGLSDDAPPAVGFVLPAHPGMTSEAAPRPMARTNSRRSILPDNFAARSMFSSFLDLRKVLIWAEFTKNSDLRFRTAKIVFYESKGTCIVRKRNAVSWQLCNQRHNHRLLPHYTTARLTNQGRPNSLDRTGLEVKPDRTEHEFSPKKMLESSSGLR